MLRSHFLYTFIVSFLLTAAGASQDSPLRIAAAPEWIGVPERPDFGSPSPAKNSGGWYFLLFDRRFHAEEGETYSHVAYRITSSSALQNGSQISVSYDPEYEHIDFHFIRVIRGGKADDRLSLAAIKTLQQERDLDRHLYNGQFTALVMLDDVRVDDVVEYAYTRRGRNPIYAGRFHDTVTVQWNTPLQKVHVSVLSSPDRTLAVKTHGDLRLRSESHVVGSLVEQRWTALDVAAIEADSGIPYWHNPYTFLQFSDYPSWDKVTEWAQPLYAIPETLSPELMQKAEELAAGASIADERALAILNFVQREIRYLGIELGPKSHRPSPPDDVFRRRFGDCKDKSLLLCAMLRHVGIGAVPALTHSYRKERMNDWLPSPDVFDHVIVCLQVHGIAYWVDPTIAEQEGKFAYRAIPDYRYALPILAGMNQLERMFRQANSNSALHVEEHYDVSSFDGPARLEVRSRYSGSAADSMRVYLRETPVDQITKNYLNTRLRLQPKITSDGEPSWTENKNTNTLTLTHRYLVPEMWLKAKDSPVLTLEIYPAMMRDYTELPDSPERSMPLAISHPLSITQETFLKLPHAWPEQDETETFTHDAFNARVQRVIQGDSVTVRYTWESRKDYVPATNVRAYAEKLRSFRDNLGYTLTYDTAIASRNSRFRLYWPLVLSLIAGLVLCAVGMEWYRRRYFFRAENTPPPLPSHSSLYGLGGWLILVGFGLFSRPIIDIFQFGSGYGQFFDARSTETLTLPESTGYISGFAQLLLVEAAIEVIFFVSSIGMIVLFLRKHRHFPKVFIIWALSALVWTIINTVWGQVVIKEPSEDTATTQEIVRLAISCAIWVPYMLTSRRVRTTFVH